MSSDFLLQAIAGFSQGFAKGYVPAVQTRLESELRRKELEEKLRLKKQLEQIPTELFSEEEKEKLGIPFNEREVELAPPIPETKEQFPSPKLPLGTIEIVLGEPAPIPPKEITIKQKEYQPTIPKEVLKTKLELNRIKQEQNKAKERLKARFKDEDDRIFEKAFRFVKLSNPFFHIEDEQKQIDLLSNAIEKVKMLNIQAKQPPLKVSPQKPQKETTRKHLQDIFGK